MSTGNVGLTLSLLCEIASAQTGRVADEARRRTAEVERLSGVPLQDACWLLSGLCDHVRLTGDESSVAAVRMLFGALMKRYMVNGCLFPRHLPTGPRRHIVSFGGVTYFLRALNDVAESTHDEFAAGLCSELTLRVIAAQGTCGEWPWHYDAQTGRVLELYEVYAVHQEAMAMLFLLPALRRGVAGAELAIRRSYRWILGENELGVPMFNEDPFMPYRSIRRRLPLLSEDSRSRTTGAGNTLERGRSWAVAGSRRALGLAAAHARPTRLEVNRECRSYEIGWMLYVWSGVSGFDEFTSDIWVPIEAKEDAPPALGQASQA
jgi:hypothetical protein